MTLDSAAVTSQSVCVCRSFRSSWASCASSSAWLPSTHRCWSSSLRSASPLLYVENKQLWLQTTWPLTLRMTLLLFQFVVSGSLALVAGYRASPPHVSSVSNSSVFRWGLVEPGCRRVWSEGVFLVLQVWASLLSHMLSLVVSVGGVAYICWLLASWKISIQICDLSSMTAQSDCMHRVWNLNVSLTMTETRNRLSPGLGSALVRFKEVLLQWVKDQGLSRSWVLICLWFCCRPSLMDFWLSSWSYWSYRSVFPQVSVFSLENPSAVDTRWESAAVKEHPEIINRIRVIKSSDRCPFCRCWAVWPLSFIYWSIFRSGFFLTKLGWKRGQHVWF